MWYLRPIQINAKNPLDFSGGRISLTEFKQFDQGLKILSATELGHLSFLTTTAVKAIK